MKIACLVTGAPRTYSKCVDSLKRFLRNHEVDFYCVFRDDNTDKENTEEILLKYNPVKYKVTTAKDTEFKEQNTIFHWPFLRMWHEVFVGMKLIEPDKDKYDYFIRVRFDAFFGNEVVVEDIPNNTCVLPKNYSFLGANDMFCIADWNAFCAYSSVYSNLELLQEKLRKFTPEVIVITNLKLSSTSFIETDISMSLRRPLYDHLTDAEYAALNYKEINRLLIKYRNFETNPSAHEKEIQELTQIAKQESKFPTNSTPSNHFYPPEYDESHQKYYRFFSAQSWIYRYIDKESKYFRLVLRHIVRHVSTDLFVVFIEGETPHLNITEHPNGGWLVTGIIPDAARGKAPNVKIGFMFNYTVVPSEAYEDSTDNRLLSAAITEPEFLKSLDDHALS